MVNGFLPLTHLQNTCSKVRQVKEKDWKGSCLHSAGLLEFLHSLHMSLKHSWDYSVAAGEPLRKMQTGAWRLHKYLIIVLHRTNMLCVWIDKRKFQSILISHCTLCVLFFPLKTQNVFALHIISTYSHTDTQMVEEAIQRAHQCRGRALSLSHQHWVRLDGKTSCNMSAFRIKSKKLGL